MPSTYTLISSNVLASSAASVTFSAIPSTYTDLVLRISARASGTTVTQVFTQLNSDTGTNYSYTWLRGNGTAAASSLGATATEEFFGQVPGASGTTNTFGNSEYYFPSYLSSTKKQFALSSVTENNTAGDVYAYAIANLWQGTAAITSIKLFPTSGETFLTNSSFYLYGIKNS